MAYFKLRVQGAGLTNIEIGGAMVNGKTQAGFRAMPVVWMSDERVLG